MKTLLAALVLLPGFALAQVNVDVNVALPQIHFVSPPALVVVQPGVQVVEDYDEEVYVVDSWYWVRRDGRWFKTKDHKGQWVLVEQRAVPVTIVKLPPGQYKKWKGGKKTVVIVPAGHDDHGGDHKGKGKHKGKHK